MSIEVKQRERDAGIQAEEKKKMNTLWRGDRQEERVRQGDQIGK